MTNRLILALTLTALLGTPAIAQDTEPPADPPRQLPTQVAGEAHSAVAGAPMPHDHVPALDIIEKVDAFYHKAWLKLVIIITGLILTVGIIVPLVIQHLQSKSFEAAKKELKDDIAAVEEASGERAAQAEDRIRQTERDISRQMKADLTETEGRAANALQDYSLEIRRELHDTGYDFYVMLATNMRNQPGLQPGIYIGTLAMAATQLLGATPAKEKVALWSKVAMNYVKQASRQAGLAENKEAVDFTRHVVGDLLKLDWALEADTIVRLEEFRSILDKCWDTAQSSDP